MDLNNFQKLVRSLDLIESELKDMLIDLERPGVFKSIKMLLISVRNFQESVEKYQEKINRDEYDIDNLRIQIGEIRFFQQINELLTWSQTNKEFLKNSEKEIDH